MSVLQVEIFWMRALSDPEYKRIFCLVHAEKLSYKVSDSALHSLAEHSQGRHGNKEYITICS